MIELFDLINMIGTVAFAVSGALTAIDKKMDAFGVLIIAFVTALGGGTLCDILIGRTPVSWMTQLDSVYLIGIAYIAAILFYKKQERLRLALFIFDTVGLGIFTLIGLKKGLAIHLNPLICIALGTITGCFGGVIRDVLCTEIPTIFKKEIYATSCILGGAVFFILKQMNVNNDVIHLIALLTIICTRLIVTYFGWHLPTLEYSQPDEPKK
jgi:uncharacterized membrane protein YeiH